MPAVDLEQVVQELFTEDLVCPFAQILRACCPDHFSSIVCEGKGNFRMSERVMSHQVCEVESFRSFRSQELASCGNIEEQVSYGNRCPLGMGRVFHVTHATTFDNDFC